MREHTIFIQKENRMENFINIVIIIVCIGFAILAFKLLVAILKVLAIVGIAVALFFAVKGMIR